MVERNSPPKNEKQTLFTPFCELKSAVQAASAVKGNAALLCFVVSSRNDFGQRNLESADIFWKNCSFKEEPPQRTGTMSMKADSLCASPSHGELSKVLDLLSDDLDTSFIGGVELQHPLSVKLWTLERQQRRSWYKQGIELRQM